MFGSGVLCGFFARCLRGFFSGFAGGFSCCLFACGLCSSGLAHSFGAAFGFFCFALLFFFGAVRGFFFPPSGFFGLSFGFEAGAFFGFLSGGDVVEGVLQGARVHDLGGNRRGVVLRAGRLAANGDFDGVFAAKQEDEEEAEDAEDYARDAAQFFLPEDVLWLAAFSHCALPAPFSGGCSVTRPTFLAPPCCRRTMPSMTRL